MVQFNCYILSSYLNYSKNDNILYIKTKLTIIPLLFLIQSQIFSITASSQVFGIRFLADPYDE